MVDMPHIQPKHPTILLVHANIQQIFDEKKFTLLEINL